MKKKPERTPGRSENGIAQKVAAVAFGAGCCFSIWIYGKGNQEILALPFAFWIGVSCWPKRIPAPRPSQPAARFGGTKKQRLVWAGVVVSWVVAVIGLCLPDKSTAHSRSSQTIVEADLTRAESFYQRGKFSESLALLDRLTIPKGNSKAAARLCHDRGLALLRLRRTADASASFWQSLQLDPKNVEAACLLSEISLARGDNEAARSYLEKARAADPSDDSVKRLSGRLMGSTNAPKAFH